MAAYTLQLGNSSTTKLRPYKSTDLSKYIRKVSSSFVALKSMLRN